MTLTWPMELAIFLYLFDKLKIYFISLGYIILWIFFFWLSFLLVD